MKLFIKPKPRIWWIWCSDCKYFVPKFPDSPVGRSLDGKCTYGNRNEEASLIDFCSKGERKDTNER